MPVQLFGRDQIVVEYQNDARTNSNESIEQRASKHHSLELETPPKRHLHRPKDKKQYDHMRSNMILATPPSQKQTRLSPTPKRPHRERSGSRKSSFPRLFTPYTDEETSDVSNTATPTKSPNDAIIANSVHTTPNLVSPPTSKQLSPLPVSLLDNTRNYQTHAPVPITLKDKVKYHSYHYSVKIRQFLDNVNLSNVPKISNVSILHWFLLFGFITLLLYHFIFVFSKLYSYSPVLNNICTNVLLMGISDNMAQIIEIKYNNRSAVMSRNGDLVKPEYYDGMDSFTMHPFRVRSVAGSVADPSTVPSTTVHGEDPQIVDPSLDDLFDLENQKMKSPNNELPLTISLDQSIGKENFKCYRWVCFIFWGAMIAVPQCFWYKILNFYFTEDPSIVQILERMLSDQLVYSPILLYMFFYYSNYVMEHGTVEKFQQKLKDLYLSTIMINYMIWPLAQIINFSIVKPHYQPIFSSTISLFWNCLLSYRNSLHHER
ncbi:hypothetical protein ACO0QE_000143 [Hanseniaspora vineae]